MEKRAAAASPEATSDDDDLVGDISSSSSSDADDGEHASAEVAADPRRKRRRAKPPRQQEQPDLAAMRDAQARTDVTDGFSARSRSSDAGVKWHPVVSGLSVCREFVSFAERASLLAQVDDELLHRAHRHPGTASGPVNQAMAFGAENFPPLSRLLASQVRDRMSRASPSTQRGGHGVWERGCDCGFNQLIANEYQPGEGIKAHVDLVRFADGIAAVSLGSSAVMVFRRAGPGQAAAGREMSWQTMEQKKSRSPLAAEGNNVSGDDDSVRVLLLPGDLLCLEGDARWKWTHEIEPLATDQWGGTGYHRARRVSVTFRQLATSHPAQASEHESSPMQR